MADSETKLNINETAGSQVPSSAYSRRRETLTETGSVFTSGKVGGKTIRIPANEAETMKSSSISGSSGASDSGADTAKVYVEQKPAANKRASISTNRIFSPYGLSFFEDPVTTRELSDSERKRITQRNNGEKAVASSSSAKAKPNVLSSQLVSPFGISMTASAAEPQNSTSNTASAHAQAPKTTAASAGKPVFKAPTASASPASSSSRILTPENNTFPDEPVPSAVTSQKNKSSSSSRILTPENNTFPENSTFTSNPVPSTRKTAPQPAAPAPVQPQKSVSSADNSAVNDYDSAVLSMYGFSNVLSEDSPAGAEKAAELTKSFRKVPETPAVVYPSSSRKKTASPSTQTFSSVFSTPSVSTARTTVSNTSSVRRNQTESMSAQHTMVIPTVSAAAGAAAGIAAANAASAGATRAVDLNEIAAQERTVVKKKKAVSSAQPSAKQLKASAGGGGGGSHTSGGRASNASSGKKSGVLRIITIILIVGIVLELIAGITGLAVINGMIKDAPDLNLTDFVGEESTKIYDDSGNLVTEVGVYLRQNITYDKCPESLVDAFLSIEDSRFFSHFGFDIPRFTAALIDNIKTHSFGQGGSTFTMQLVKNTYFSVDSMNAEETGTERTRNIEYKVQQIYLAIKLEKLLSKKEIFQLYLNKLNFGGNIRGVQRASQYYFGKNCNELTLDESAMLAGIVNLPNRYNPYEYLDYGTSRRNTVLDLMKQHGYITDEEKTLAKMVKVENTLVGDTRQASEDSQYQSYLDVVLEEAMELTGLDPTVKGMKIYTHLNRAMQEEVEAIQNGQTDVVFPDDLMQVAMISMDNHTGAIVAVGGGRNYDGARLLNRATMNYKQPGSSVKPLLSYALAFEHLGYSMDEVLLDKPITYPMESMVLVNANGTYQGDVSIKDAVGNSLNIPAILTLKRVVDKIGSDKVVEYLNTIGFSHVTKENFHLSYAIGGTTFESTCKELAGAHSMLINGGVYNKPHTIQKVVMTADGSEIYPTGQNVQALSSGSAYLSALLEENNVTGPYFNYMQVLARSYPVYAKTGTTDWGNDGVQYGIPRGQMKDKWMVASSSKYTNVVWVGYDMAVAGKETYYTSYKSSLNIPGNINRLLLDKEEELFGVPEAIQQPEDVEESTYIYGTFPHVKPEYAMDGGGTITSLVSKTGLKNMPLCDVNEFLEYAKSESEFLGTSGISASIDQFGILNVYWGNSSGICSGGQRNIGLHDAYNDIDQWGTCMVDLSWLTGDGSYWATVYVNDIALGDITSTNGFFTGYVDAAGGTVKVCGGSATADGSDNTACTVAAYIENANPNGYIDENGNWVQLETSEYDQYGYWDENGNWVGQGFWDENGFHLE